MSSFRSPLLKFYMHSYTFMRIRTRMYTCICSRLTSCNITYIQTDIQKTHTKVNTHAQTHTQTHKHAHMHDTQAYTLYLFWHLHMHIQRRPHTHTQTDAHAHAHNTAVRQPNAHMHVQRSRRSNLSPSPSFLLLRRHKGEAAVDLDPEKRRPRLQYSGRAQRLLNSFCSAHHLHERTIVAVIATDRDGWRSNLPESLPKRVAFDRSTCCSSMLLVLQQRRRRASMDLISSGFG